MFKITLLFISLTFLLLSSCTMDNNGLFNDPLNNSISSTNPEINAFETFTLDDIIKLHFPEYDINNLKNLYIICHLDPTLINDDKIRENCLEILNQFSFTIAEAKPIYGSTYTIGFTFDVSGTEQLLTFSLQDYGMQFYDFNKKKYYNLLTSTNKTIDSDMPYKTIKSLFDKYWHINFNEEKNITNLFRNDLNNTNEILIKYTTKENIDNEIILTKYSDNYYTIINLFQKLSFKQTNNPYYLTNDDLSDLKYIVIFNHTEKPFLTSERIPLNYPYYLYIRESYINFGSLYYNWYKITNNVDLNHYIEDLIK